MISKSVARKRLGDSNDDHQNAIIGDEVNSIQNIPNPTNLIKTNKLKLFP